MKQSWPRCYWYESTDNTLPTVTFNKTRLLSVAATSSTSKWFTTNFNSTILLIRNMTWARSQWPGVWLHPRIAVSYQTDSMCFEAQREKQTAAASHELEQNKRITSKHFFLQMLHWEYPVIRIKYHLFKAHCKLFRLSVVPKAHTL